MTKFFKQFILGSFGAVLVQIWRKMNFPKKELCQFLNIPIIYHGAKNLKKLTTHP